MIVFVMFSKGKHGSAVSVSTDQASSLPDEKQHSFAYGSTKRNPSLSDQTKNRRYSNVRSFHVDRRFQAPPLCFLPRYPYDTARNRSHPFHKPNIHFKSWDDDHRKSYGPLRFYQLRIRQAKKNYSSLKLAIN